METERNRFVTLAALLEGAASSLDRTGGYVWTVAGAEIRETLLSAAAELRAWATEEERSPAMAATTSLAPHDRAAIAFCAGLVSSLLSPTNTATDARVVANAVETLRTPMGRDMLLHVIDLVDVKLDGDVREMLRTGREVAPASHAGGPR